MAQYEGKVKLAVFESSTKYPYRMIYTEEEGKTTGLAQISDYATVEFRYRDFADVVQGKVDAISKEIDTIKAESLEKINQLSNRRQELLAIAYSPAADPTTF